MIRALALAVGRQMNRVQKSNARIFVVCGVTGGLVVLLSVWGYWIAGVVILLVLGLLQVCFSLAVGAEIDAALNKRAKGSPLDPPRHDRRS